MGAQGVQHHLVGGQGRDGGVQRSGQVFNAAGGQLGGGHGVDVLRDLRRRRQAPLNAVQTGGQTRGEHQVRIAGGVRAPQLHPGALAPGSGDADEGRAVRGGPGQIAGGLVAGHQPLVGVHQGIRQGTEALGVFQQTCDELIGQGGELTGGVFIKEHVLSVLEQGHVDVHAVAGGAVDGLGHERGVKAVLLRQSLHRQLEGHDDVGGVEGIGVLEVDFVLAGGHLVMAGLHLNAHVLQRQADLPAGALAVVQRAQVEVAGLIGGLGGGIAVVIGLEQEELRLRAHIKYVSHPLCPGQSPLQHAPGVAHEGRAVGVVDLADQTGHLAVLRAPGQHREGVQVRPEVLVGFLNADKALNGAAVHHDLVVHGPLNLGGGDRYVFQLTENIGELHTDELNVLFFHQPDDIFLGVFAHGRSPFGSD